ncbi:hypothetical protein DUI87_11244 [Hirundo rustica rustica]|uniref:RNase H type-1 domain-containing protein n=1 Tax=Hirundo rustica rustica TaxID=333673 RepID=A0A3M0KFV3_HIRRU|nr:hypothetical protein DUI87_11244 [Hirundo rustica rustica]
MGDPLYHREDPIVNFEVGPQNETFEFLVDTGANRSSLRKLPAGMTIRKKTCEVMGEEGKPFKASVITSVEVKGNSRQAIADFIYLPDLDTNLLGRDLQVQLGIGVIPEEGRRQVKILKLTAKDLEEINPGVWAEGGKSGLLDIPPIKVEIQAGNSPVRVKQYPISPEGRKGLAPVIEQLLEEGILEPSEECRDWFAFEWEHPESKRKQQLRCTRLPQRFTEAPNLFGQALEKLLEQFIPEGQVQMLQLWIDQYTQSVKFLYNKLVNPEPIVWTEEDDNQLKDLKYKLSTAPVLSLPNLRKEFDLFVNVEEGVAYGVVTQEWAQFLSGEPPQELDHDCLELMGFQTKVREDLEDTPLPYGRKLFTDGPSKIIEGRRASGYVVIEGSTKEDLKMLEAKKLPSQWSAQLCEIYALKRGLDLLEGDQGTIYTDSKYAFGIVHTFGKIWEERAYLNSKGKDLIHKELIKVLLISLLKPSEIAVVHVRGHQRGNSLEEKGNQMADSEAKRVAQELGEPTKIMVMNQSSGEEEDREKPVYNKKELKAIEELGMQQSECGVWIAPDGRKFLNKPLARRMLQEIHELTHWGTQGLCDHFLRQYLCIGAYELGKTITQGCTICQKVNHQAMRKTTPRGRELTMRPFQNAQIDFTEMPPAQGYQTSFGNSRSFNSLGGSLSN